MSEPADRPIEDRLDDALAAFWEGDTGAIEGLVNEQSDGAGAGFSDVLRTARDATTSRLPECAGFELVRELGRGGMGVVYEARQEHPARDVALKVIRSAATSDPRMKSLFKREVATLARLTHPGIAALHEVGVTSEGDPFFVMELVSGRSLASVLPQAGVTSDVRPTLELFIKICEAVNYAHQRGVIHRDLKPTNVAIDGHGNPKILDFGLARLVEGDAAVTTLNEGESFVGTLPYMSPERLDGEADLDTRSDVYALGVMLYEMLTGRLPHDVSKSSLAQAIRVVRETAPSRPSEVRRELRGDLDVILGTALERDVSRRYQSAADLAADVRRYLDGEPISARAPSAWYVFTRFAKRNKVAVAASVVLVASLAGATVVSLNSAYRARLAEGRARDERNAAVEAADRERAFSAFLERVVLAPDPAVDGYDVSLYDALTNAAATVDELDEQPDAMIRIHQLLASTFNTLHKPEMGEKHARLAIRSWDAARRPDPVERIRAGKQLAFALHDLGRFDEAVEELDAAIAIASDGDPEEYALKLQAMHSRAEIIRDMGRMDEGESALREVLTLKRGIPNNESMLVATLSSLASVLIAKDEIDESEALLNEALELRARVDQPPYETLSAVNNLAAVYMGRGEFERAAGLLQPLSDDLVERWGPHPNTITAMTNLWNCQYQLQQFKAAEETVMRTMPMCREYPEYATPLLQGLWVLSIMYTEREEWAEAIPLLRELIAGASSVLPESSEMHDMFALRLCVCLSRTDAFDEAEERLLALRERMGRVYPEGSEPRVEVDRALVEMYERSGRPERASPFRSSAP